MKMLRLSLGGAALTPPGAVMSSTSRRSCSVFECFKLASSSGSLSVCVCVCEYMYMLTVHRNMSLLVKDYVLTIQGL